MSILFNSNGVRIEVLKTKNGSLDIWKHGLAREPYGVKGLHGAYRCTDLDENLFHLGPEETERLKEFLLT